MCARAEHLIARKAMLAAQAEYDLLETVRLEERDHPKVLVNARAILEARGDRMALEAFEWATAPKDDPQMDRAREMVENASV